MADDEDFLIHPDRLSEKPQLFEGTFGTADLERLEGSVADEPGQVAYRISASLDRQRRKVVSCIIEGFVFLTCQSTLETFRFGISVQDKLVLVDRESELPAIDREGDDEDYLVASEPLDIRDLVEDAVLLALPMVPRKPGVEPREEGKAAEGKPSPFAVLAELKPRQGEK